MKKAKAARVPILENAFELNLPKLIRAVKATDDFRVVLDDGDVRTVAVLAETRLAVFLGARHWVVDIVSVQCLQGRLRPLLRCPRAHEGNFQSLYYHSSELACRQCHQLRYRTNVAANAVQRARIARSKLMSLMGAGLSESIERPPYKWRSRHARLSIRLEQLATVHYQDVRAWLQRDGL